jgi:hypothetical protein
VRIVDVRAYDIGQISKGNFVCLFKIAHFLIIMISPPASRFPPMAWIGVKVGLDTSSIDCIIGIRWRNRSSTPGCGGGKQIGRRIARDDKASP